MLKFDNASVIVQHTLLFLYTNYAEEKGFFFFSYTECALNCICGDLDEDKCKCNCRDGYVGNDCSISLCITAHGTEDRAACTCVCEEAYWTATCGCKLTPYTSDLATGSTEIETLSRGNISDRKLTSTGNLSTLTDLFNRHFSPQTHASHTNTLA